MTKDKINQINVYTRQDFRNWLQKNHDKETKVAIIIHKKHTGKPTVSHHDQIEEAICFGWIDTTLRRLDNDTYLRNFVKRNKNSRWSNNTIRYAKDLIKRGLMTPSGMKMYKEGLKKPTHDAGIPLNPKTPEDLLKELKKNNLNEKFESLSHSVKRTHNRWLFRAKLPETRKKRIKQIVELVIRKELPYQPKKQKF